MYYLNMNWKVFVYVLFLSNYTNGTWGKTKILTNVQMLVKQRIKTIQWFN